MAAPAGWQSFNAGAYFRVWKRETNGAVLNEEHPVQATAESRAQNWEDDKAKKH